MSRKILISTLFVLAACNGAEGIGGPEDERGTLRFNHSAISQLPAATYDANGEVGLSSTGQFTLGDWAFAQLSGSAADPMSIIASQPSAGAPDRHDFAVAELPRGVQAGTTLPLSTDCASGSTTCAELGISFRLTPRGDNPDYACNLGSGEIRVTSRTSDRVAGTFSGSATCFGPASNIEQTLQVTAGTFEVSIVSFSNLR